MLRRSVAALLIAAACAASGCGIKGPLRLPPAKPGAPEAATTQPPARPSAETPVPALPDATTEVPKAPEGPKE
jgi:predicted small lipoprotein YifL